MRIVSTELRQVFRAYTKQLRGEYERAGTSQGRESVAKGFERVDISPEAKLLAQNLSNAVSAEPSSVEARPAEEVSEEEETEKEEKDKDSPKDAEGSSRNKEIAN
jgi:hypothetical protein